MRILHILDHSLPLHSGYTFRTASNIAITVLRRRIAERKRLSRLTGERTGIASPEQQLDCKFLVETLRCYMAQLPEHLRDVVMLRDLAELSYAQIGRMLGITPATARVYRCKAIQLLAVWMGKERE